MSWIKDIVDPETRALGGVLPQPLAARQGRPQHARRQLHRRLLLEHPRQGRRSSPGRCRRSTTRCSTRRPAYEPRGCQRGISFSWYLYSPLRVKYPYIRGALLDLWREARKAHEDPVEAWASIVDDPDEARAATSRRAARAASAARRWDEVLELIAAANVYTVKKHGPDRIIGFSPIPAMSMLSYAAGSRFLQLLGGVNLSLLRLVLRPAARLARRSGASRPTSPRAPTGTTSKFIAVDGRRT